MKTRVSLKYFVSYCRKWTITAFSYVIDMAHVNSSAKLALQKKYDPCKQDSFDSFHEV